MLNQEMVVKKAEAFIEKLKNKGETYILLSPKNIYPQTWVTYPLIERRVEENYRCITVFSDMEVAKRYIDKKEYDKPYNTYPLAVLPSDPEFLVRFFFGLMYNQVTYMEIYDEENDCVISCDVMHLIECLETPLRNGLYDYQIKLFHVLGHEEGSLPIDEEEEKRLLFEAKEQLS